MIKINSCYEDNTMVIIELSREGDTDNDWLYYEKTTGEFIRLWLRNRDFANEVAEYYFEQGFLKIREDSAVFIEKFNFQQHVLNKVPAGAKILSLIEIYAGKTKTIVKHP